MAVQSTTLQQILVLQRIGFTVIDAYENIALIYIPHPDSRATCFMRHVMLIALFDSNDHLHILWIEADKVFFTPVTPKIPYRYGLRITVENSEVTARGFNDGDSSPLRKRQGSTNGRAASVSRRTAKTFNVIATSA